MDWSAFEWLHVDCFPRLIQLASLLPQKEDNLRNRITKVIEWLLKYETIGALSFVLLENIRTSGFP